MRVPQEIDYGALQESGLKLPHFFSSWISAGKTRIDPYYLENEKLVVWRFFPGDEAEGPPGYCHGGFLATLLDECMGSAGILMGFYLLAVRLEVSYRKAVDVNALYYCICRVLQSQSRRLVMEGWITDKSGTVFTRANATYLAVNPEDLKSRPHGYESFMKFNSLLKQGLSIRESFKKLGLNGSKSMDETTV